MGFLDGLSGQSGYLGQESQDFFNAVKSGSGSVDEYRSSLQDPLVVDSGDKEIDDLAKRLNVQLTDETKDYLMQYFLGEKSNENAWNRSMEASSTQYQRAVKDLQAAGLNPFLAFQGLSGSAPSSAGMSQGSGYYTSNKKNDVNAGVKAGTAIVAMLFALAGMAMKASTAGS